jgi:hypothetical protein
LEKELQAEQFISQNFESEVKRLEADLGKSEAERERLRTENADLKGGYCACETLSHYKLFLEGEKDVRHSECGKLLRPEVRAALAPRQEEVKPSEPDSDYSEHDYGDK